ncbi:MAG: glutamate-1-semialdehyde 2,1-aminomutase [bacterium]|jgi:glutamate-1-semialdehyde 2,1-aminomutase|nr:MAG: glutamate-1-semialdehyde-2,1-aminomutase [Pseudomonadota bacterium]HBM53329.1 glutamate-1-semialdehyde-2,1-aminomutase [Deltaproteobacteria bacterium]|tara:strand:- start:2437 stop:3720 length:1284 start_codon:yes stop_codon:yes gene_type:complete
MQINQSSSLFARAQLRIPGGVNSPVRAFKSVRSTPLFIREGKGSHITDVDGNDYIDYIGSWGPLILGHCHPEVMAAIEEALHRGASFGTPTEGEVHLAEMICTAVNSVEMVRLTNSGTEASMAAIRVARGYTGRDKIIKFEGCYHGSVDSLLVKAGSGVMTLGLPDSPGVPASFVEHTLLADFNNLESVTDLFDEYGSEIAAVVLEPVAGNMGMVVPDLDFLKGLRNLCDVHGSLLVFDEVMTGFRVDYGGAQEIFGIIPDMTIFGKVIGGGLPVGAYGGRQDVMLMVAPAGPVYQAGTLSGNPLAVAAGRKTLEILQAPDTYAELSRKSNWLIDEMRQSAGQNGIPFQTNVMGGMFGFFFAEKPVRNYQDAAESDQDRFRKFFMGMLKEGIYLAPSAFESGFISMAHTEEDLEKTAAACRKVMATL